MSYAYKKRKTQYGDDMACNHAYCLCVQVRFHSPSDAALSRPRKNEVSGASETSPAHTSTFSEQKPDEPPTRLDRSPRSNPLPRESPPPRFPLNPPNSSPKGPARIQTESRTVNALSLQCVSWPSETARMEQQLFSIASGSSALAPGEATFTQSFGREMARREAHEYSRCLFWTPKAVLT